MAPPPTPARGHGRGAADPAPRWTSPPGRRGATPPRSTDDGRVRLTGLEQRILEAAEVGHVVAEPGSVPAAAVGAAYRHLEQYGLLDADWWGDDVLPLMVGITPAGRAVLRHRD